MAAYGARAGLEVYVFMPEDAPKVNAVESDVVGAKVVYVKGLISDAGKLVKDGEREMGWFSVATLGEPYRVEGKKTMGLEVAEQLDWKLPDVIVYPTGRHRHHRDVEGLRRTRGDGVDRERAPPDDQRTGRGLQPRSQSV